MPMTEKQIIQAIEAGHVVVVGDDRLSRICKDFFGSLVVESFHGDAEPTRLATLSDKRRARILDKSNKPQNN